MHGVQHQQEIEIVCMGKLLSPTPAEKKLITWSGSDKGKTALHSLDRDLRLGLRNFFLLYKKLNEYQEVAH